MHIIEALGSDFYEVEIAGQPADRGDIFAGWNARDRFGIVLYEPLLVGDCCGLQPQRPRGFARLHHPQQQPPQ